PKRQIEHHATLGETLPSPPVDIQTRLRYRDNSTRETPHVRLVQEHSWLRLVVSQVCRLHSSPLEYSWVRSSGNDRRSSPRSLITGKQPNNTKALNEASCR